MIPRSVIWTFLLGLALGCTDHSRPGGAAAAAAGAEASIVCGDTDSDGRFETEDIQQCIDAMQEGGRKTVQLLPGLTYAALVQNGPYYNDLGFVELESNTTLDCQGSRIRGIDHIAKMAPNTWGPLWVVTNSDHENDSQHDIWVRNCEIDGGMPASYDESANPFDHDTYVGFALHGVSTGGIVDSQVHDTHHSCVYIRDSKDITVERNTLTDCGGANNHGSARKPAVYLFQNGAKTEERIVVRNNTALRAGSQLFNTRVSDGHDEYQTAWMRDIVFEGNYGDQEGNGRPCFVLRGARQIAVRGNICVETGGIATSALSEGFCSDNPTFAVDGNAESSCLEAVVIEDNLLLDTRAEVGNGALSIYAYHDGVSVRNNEVRGTRRLGLAPIPCVRWKTPIRGFVLGGLVASDCDGAGIEQATAAVDQVDVPVEEAVSFLDVEIDGSAAEGVLLRRRLEYLEIDGLDIRGTVREGIRSDAALVASAIRDYTVDGLGDPPIAVAIRIGGASDLLLENGWIQNALGPGIWFVGDPPVGITISGLTCAQPAFGTGIDQPMSHCADNDAGGTGHSLSGVVCLDHTGDAACIEGF